MPQKCCVPGCKSNYSSQEYISVFTFPSDPDLKEKWLQLIGRKDYVVNKNSVVCAKHFEPDFVVTVDSVQRDDGTLLCVSRAKPKLKSDAFPTIFPDVSPPSTESLKRIKTVSGKFNKKDTRESDGALQNCIIKDSVTSFQSLCREINSHIYHWNSTSDLSAVSQNVERARDQQLSAEADHGEAAYIALKLEFLEQQRKYMHTFTDHYIDRMITEGKSWARNTVADRPGFSEMCQSLDKAVEFLCLMCEELSSTVTAEIKDVKLAHPEQCRTSPEFPASARADDSASRTSAASYTRQSLKSGPATGMYSCPQCSTVFSHHSMLYKHITESHSSGSSGQASLISADICAEFSGKPDSEGGHRGGDGINTLEHLNTESPTVVTENCGDTETGVQISSRSVKKGSRAVLKADAGDKIGDQLNVAEDRNEINLKQTRSCRSKMADKSDVSDSGHLNVVWPQMHKRKQKTSLTNISQLSEVSSEKIQEYCDTVISNKLHSENPNSNEVLQITDCAKETQAEISAIKKLRKSRQKKIRIYSAEKPYMCGICNAGFKSAARFQSHKRKHQGGQSFQCDICDAGFDRSYQLKAHMSRHTGVKPFHCDVCGAGFTVKSTMQIHMRKHTGEKPYVCDDCGAEFVNRRKLKIHRISHTGEKPYKCDVCDAGFNQAFSLQLHKRKHTGEKPYKCDVCGLEFTSNCSLKMHSRRHTGEKPYRCDICGVGFTHNVGLQIHKSRHKGDKPYVCEICGLKFSVSYSLQYHKRKHTGAKLHKCDVCGVSFSVKTSLLNHQRKHTGETPYNCDICGLQFSVITSLQNHRRKHTGEKPYLCDICGTEFAHKGSLRDHKRLHTGEKPYRCDLCGEDFSNRKKLQRHRKVHTAENLYMSDVSGLDYSESEAVLLV